MAEQTTQPQTGTSSPTRAPRSSFGTRPHGGPRGTGKPGAGGPRGRGPRRAGAAEGLRQKATMGIGIGKAGDTTLAIQKAFNDAKKNIIKVRMTKNGTIEHDVAAKYKSARVMLMPNTGRGVVVGSAMRVVVELGGLTDITGRVISGSKNKLNIAQATIKALSKFALPKKTRASLEKPAVVA